MHVKYISHRTLFQCSVVLKYYTMFMLNSVTVTITDYCHF